MPICRKEYKRISGGVKIKPMPATLAVDWLSSVDALYVEEWKTFVIRKEGEVAYKLKSTDSLARTISRYGVHKFPSLKITQSFCKDVLWCAISLLDDKHILKEPPTKHAAFKDYLLDLYTMEPIPLGTAPTVIGFDANLSDVLKAEGTLWDAYLQSTFVKEDGTHDPDLAFSFQETAGTLLLASRAVSSAVFLYGPTAGNGKSTCLDVFRGVFAKELTSAMSIASLVDNRFATTHLLAKRFNFCGEIGTKYAKSDLFKSIVTGDLIPAEYKHGENFEFVPEVSLWFAVNAVPTWEGLDDGLMRRMRMYHFRADFKGKGRVDGLAKRIVAQELDVVLRWMIEGARRLRDNGYAFSPAADAAIKPSMETLEQESSAILRFVMERGWKYSASASTMTAEVFQDYKNWCDAVNCKASNDNNFKTEFMRVTKCGSPFSDWHMVSEGGKLIRRNRKSFRAMRIELADDETIEQFQKELPDF